MQREMVFELGFTCASGPGAVTVASDGTAFPAEAGELLGVRLEHEGAAWRLFVEPTCEVELGYCTARMAMDLASWDVVYHNGYQSWTDSVERNPAYTMHDLRHVPRSIMEKWILDGGGDYAFAYYALERGLQHGFGYCYLRRGDDVLLIGSLGEDLGLTSTYTSLKRGLLVVAREAQERPLAAGESREVLGFALLEGSYGSCFAEWARLAGIKARPCPALVGFSSWYRHYDDISQGKLLHDLDVFASLLHGVDTGTCARVFQIDDGYTVVGDWTRPSEERFPDGMGAMAERIREAGLVPGLWMAPFVCSQDSRLFAEHPDWLLRDEDGELVMTGSHWNGAYALDTLNPEVRAYVRESLSLATRTWGYKLLKLDFLYGACMLPHGGMNRGELIADALELLRESAAEGTWFDMCGVPLMSAFGRTEYCRIGCDVGLDWDDQPHMRLLHRERVSTKNSLGNTCGRAHLNGLAFRNDPDVFFLREDVKLTNEQRAALISADAQLGGVFFTSDDVGAWNEGQRRTWREALATFVAANAC